MDLVTVNIIVSIFDKLKDYATWLFKHKSKFKKSSYYFKNYHKHVTIYDNGNGIIINSFDVIFNNTDSKKIVRGIDISDGKISAEFPLLTDMKKLELKDRFDNYGFWVYSDNNIIEEAKEEYWLDNDKEQEDIAARNNKKELRWVFKLNRSKIELHKPYHVIYVMSIPGMQPILNGKIDPWEVNPDSFNEYANSSIKIETPIDELKYTVSFYNSIKLQTEPESNLKPIGAEKESNKPITITKGYNIIYNKYICYIKKPQLGSKIRIRWKFEGGG